MLADINLLFLDLDNSSIGDKIIFIMTNIIEVSQKTYEDHTSDLLKALSSAPRRRILALLKDSEHCVCHLEAHLGYRQAYLSQQLKVLRDAGLIEDRRDGWNVYYRVVDPQIFVLLDNVYQLTGQEILEIGSHNHDCPCPKCNPAQSSAG
jgi:ArsR family transcriptional regulator